MPTKEINIVSFNVPYPANYGGVIDVFFRIKALKEMGVDVNLHTFTYGRPRSAELEALCKTVTYYKRHMGLASILCRRPYIVQSRKNDGLANNLQNSDAPILLEGLHCSSMLEVLKGKKIFVRAHNVEHDYYHKLAEVESNPFKKAYYNIDARRLERYEPILLQADGIFGVTEADCRHFQMMGCRNVWLMPSSHNHDEVISRTGTGSYALYHANLSVPENIKAAHYLVDNIFSKTKHRLVIAGRSPHNDIRSKIVQYDNISLVADPDDEEMDRLISEAQVSIMVTNQPTGLKLKLLNSLYAGRHCLVNSLMVSGTELGKVCTVADSVADQIEALDRLMQQPFTQEDIEKRKQLLGDRYSNRANCRILVENI